MTRTTLHRQCPHLHVASHCHDPVALPAHARPVSARLSLIAAIEQGAANGPNHCPSANARSPHSMGLPATAPSPQQTLAELLALTADWPRPDGGHWLSLGGFYATVLGENWLPCRRHQPCRATGARPGSLHWRTNQLPRPSRPLFLPPRVHRRVQRHGALYPSPCRSAIGPDRQRRRGS